MCCLRTWGKCPDVDLMANFDPSQYTGTWYEIYRDAATPFEKDQDCVTATYGEYSDTAVTVYNRASYSSGKVNDISGIASCHGAKCKVKFNWFIPSGNYWVVDTDYTSYSVVYSCNSYFFGLFKAEGLWILSRSTTLATADTQKQTVRDKIPSYDVDNDLH